MSLNWSLKELYPSFESQEFKIDMDRLTSKINEVNEWANEIVKDNNDILIKLEDYIKKYSKLTELISKIGSFIQLSISVNTKDAEALRYSDIFEKKGQTFTYIYDFGDDWIHIITLEKIDKTDTSTKPKLIDGKGACPPEDCGGPWGYENIKVVLEDKKHPEYHDIKEWLFGYDEDDEDDEMFEEEEPLWDPHVYNFEEEREIFDEIFE